jgi:Na+/H+-translocating membrane pyrophosphatase
MGAFMAGFGLVLLLMLGLIHNWQSGIFTTISFFAGVITSVVCGFIGMRVAVFTNARTARQAEKGLRAGQAAYPGDSADLKAAQAAEGFELAFDTAFRGGAVMGFALVALGVIVLFILINGTSPGES